jgi:hypothetical protein
MRVVMETRDLLKGLVCGFLHCPTAVPAPNIPLVLPQIPIIVRQPLPILRREDLRASLGDLGSITRHCINHDFVNLSLLKVL